MWNRGNVEQRQCGIETMWNRGNVEQRQCGIETMWKGLGNKKRKSHHTVRKEIKWETEILHELVHDATQKSEVMN